MDGGQKKTNDRANYKGQLSLTLRGERWLRGIVLSQRSETLAQITTQLNDGASHTVSKRTLQHCFTVWVLGAVDLRDNHCSILTIGLHILPGQESTETGV
ncbi:uncharacterized protein TNCV_704181 [Trichonephila clavipes]|nr:uncharacterized protein TNCV_704181 [Trichonephila clavipes]